MLDPRILTFLAVCSEMNFTRAAKKLHITQPAVSQHIQYIESFYNIRAFRLEGRKLVLTPEGELLKHAFLVLKNNEDSLRQVLAQSGEKSQPLRIGATLTAGSFLLSAPLARIFRKWPDISLTVTVKNTAELLSQIDSGSLDFAVLEGNFPKASYSFHTYLRESFIPVCRAGLFSGGSVSLDELTEKRLLLREPGSGTRMILEQILAEHGLFVSDFKRTAEIGNMQTIKELVAAGCGITFLYRSAVSRELAEGTIQEIPMGAMELDHEISVVWQKDRLFEQRVLEVIREAF